MTTAVITRSCKICQTTQVEAPHNFCETCAVMASQVEGELNGFALAAQLNKAIKLAKVMAECGVTSAEAGFLSEATWALAARAAETTEPSPTTKVLTAVLLASKEG